MGAEKSIISRGKSIRQAVDIALDLLNVKKSEVDIEILENETKGVFGIGSKPAVVCVTIKGEESDKDSSLSSSSAIEDLERIIESMDMPEDASAPQPKQSGFEESHLVGKVWVENGEVFCKDAPDRYPIISSVQGVELRKNGVLIETPTVIHESDVIQVELQDEVREPSWELKLSDDKMKATLQITPGVHIIRRLKDQFPNNYIQLNTVDKKIPTIIKTDPIMDKLKALGIIHGVDYSEIARACTSEESGTFTIAKGTLPIPGKHGFFQPIKEVEIKKGLKERSNGTIDYREIQEFPSVDRGQILGIVHPPVVGYPGTSVANEPVFPPEVYPLVVTAGKGIALVEDGTKVVATDVGHPDIREKGQMIKISIIPKLLIPGDVTLETGNVHYIGAVEVLGSVQDGMVISAQGSVVVHNNTNMAKISAGSSIIVQKNIVTSEIVAGKSNILKAEIAQVLGELIEQMRRMVIAVEQLSATSAFKVSSFTITGLGPLIKILCDGKFKSFVPLSVALVNKIKSGEDVLEEEWVEFGMRMYNGFVTTPSSNLLSEQDMLRLISTAEGLYASTKNVEQDETCFVKADSVHNSQIYCSGDIQVVGKGVYGSKLHAGGSITINGFIRGGDIYGSKGVRVGEAGARCGSTTRITVPKDQSIQISMAMEDVVMQIGSAIYKFIERTPNVFARLDDDGHITIS